MSRKQRRAQAKQTPPDDISGWLRQGVQHHQAGRLDLAEPLYRKILSRKPNHADALHLLGVIALQSGASAAAFQLISQAILENGAIAAFYNSLGNVHAAENRLKEAADCFARAVALQADHIEAWSNLAAALGGLGRHHETLSCYRAILERQPQNLPARMGLAIAFAESGQSEAARLQFRQMIMLRPDLPEPIYNLGKCDQELGAVAAARGHYRRALRLRPLYAEARSNLAMILEAEGELEAARLANRLALIDRPDVAEPYNNLGNLLLRLSALDEAEAAYRRALRIMPAQPDANYHLGLLLLMTGRWREGWEAHEWRWRTRQLAPVRRQFSQAEWRGEPAVGRRLLVYAEQGYGDSLQFSRFIPQLAAMGMQIILEVPPPLIRLLRSLSGDALLVPTGEVLPPFDLQIAMMSLALRLGCFDPGQIPAPSGYLRPDPEDSARWQKRLAAIEARRVGLVWAGDARLHAPSAAAIDRRRSLAPELLAPLAEIPGIVLFSLQKSGPKAPDYLLDFMDEMKDFADSAALIAQLDLVITVDTAVAHLAGALGKPVWLLDRFDNCWRWLRERADSPWYDRLVIFRQTRPGDWPEVIARVAKALRAGSVREGEARPACRAD